MLLRPSDYWLSNSPGQALQGLPALFLRSCLSFPFLIFLAVVTNLAWSPVALANESTSTPFMPNLATLQEDTSSNGSFLSAEQAFPLTWQANDDGWTVTFAIEPGYYLYQDRTHLSGFNPDLATRPRMSFRQTAETKFDKNFGLVQVFHDRLDIEVIHAGQSPLVLTWQGCSDQQLCYPPKTITLHEGISMQDASAGGSSTAAFSRSGNQMPLTKSERGLFSIWGDFVGIGLALILTSCVIPLIPMIISLVSATDNGQSRTRHGLNLSLAFVAGISTSYAVIGVLAATLGASVNLVAMTQTPWVIGLVSTLIASAGIYLAIYASPQREARQQFLNTGTPLVSLPELGVTGYGLTTFALGFGAALVVSPCISAPIGGAMTAIASSANPLTGGSAMFVMGLTMGLPVIVAGTLTATALPWFNKHLPQLRVICGMTLLIVALVLLDRVVDDSLILGLAGVLAMVTGVSLGALDFSPPSAKSNSTALPLHRTRQTAALFCLIVGVLWLVGAAMGNHSWTRPLAPATAEASFGNLNALASESTENITYTNAAALMSAINNGDSRRVVVDITADWCSSCEDLNELLQSGLVVDVLKNNDIRLLRFDITHTRREQLELLASLGVFGPPALQKFMPDGSAAGTPLHGVPAMSELTNWLTHGQ